MNTESQNTEFKESWRDEYQKWICGFANAQGGTLYIGVRDNGEVCGVPYNPGIANTFFRAGEIEAWGRGIERIITACKNDGFSTPEFRYDASGIWTIFKFEYPERATTQKTTQKNDQKATRRRPESDQSKQEDVIIELLKGNPYISRKEISGQLGLHDSSVKRRLASLQKKGVIKRIGPDKGGYWEIIE